MSDVQLAIRLNDMLPHATEMELEQLVRISTGFRNKPRPCVTLVTVFLQLELDLPMDRAETFALALINVLFPAPTNSIGLITAMEQQLRQEVGHLRIALRLAVTQMRNARSSLGDAWTPRALNDLDVVIRQSEELTDE